MILTKIAIFGFILTIANSDDSRQRFLYAPLNGEHFYDVCTSGECNDTASTILKSMDPKIEPCIDFYKFTCGNFDKNEIIPGYESRYEMADVTIDKINVALKGLIEAKIELNETKSFALIKTFYKSCVNTEAINASGYEPIREILNKLGGWPLVVGDTWNETQFDWRYSMSKFRDIGDNAKYFIDYDIIDIGVEDTMKQFIMLQRPSTSSRYEFQYYGVNNKTNVDDLQRIRYLAEQLGANESNVLSEISETYDFETNLYNIIKSVDETPDADVYFNMTIDEMDAIDLGVRWKRYINGILPSGIIVDDNEIIFMKGASYFRELITLMSETPKRVLANYVFRKFVIGATSLLNVTENPSVRPRWEQCVNIVNEKLPRIVGAMYAREYVTNETRSNVEEIITDLMDQLNDTLTKASWMNEETRNAAIEKVIAMNYRIGYPDELFDDTSLEEYHANLTFTEDNYLGNMFNITSFVHYDKFNDFLKPAIKTDWGNDKKVTSVNADYLPWINALRIPAGVIRDIFYGNDRPDYLNYGSIGMFIGHEIGHGFDYEGIDHDKDGNVRDWWESTNKQNYRERVGCMSEQYSNYTVDKIGRQLKSLTGTRNEIIADNIGLRLAYGAYVRRLARKFQSSRFEEPRLNGLEKYSPRQMFWISFASSWCERNSAEFLSSQINDDVHPITEYRVIGPMSNIEEFANDFQCSKFFNSTSVHTIMIPEKTCTVW